MLITLTEAAEKIRAANKILITAHVQPDGDAIGSTLALMQMLRSIGKSAQIFIDDTVRKNLHALPHFEEIRRPKDGEKFDADLMIVLDTSPDRIGNVKNLTDAPVLNIDHHVTNKNDLGDLYVETKAAATCEIIFKLAGELDAPITPEIATCLYTGLATDTGFFQFSNTRAETLAIAAELIRCGVSPHFISEQLEKKSLAEVRGLSAALNSLKMFYDDKVAGMILDHDTAKKFDSTEGFIDEIRVIETVDVAFLITEKAPNVCRVSMRSKGVDVSKVAAKLGGGGHIRAAGCTLKTTLAEAEKILVAAIGEAFNN
ncbi:MAG: bifunctional oligoribonuclease/PAP phosphatase NrnA [Selenomonadaceae bacterium]|nr:bifunctional oligoribonuclease/PAP phosphatase NrnA [Selenomonadaceae bacterium]MBQ7493726.1 bifunctional oligoribonuclease/PAP phosphatase NrnA [Selenomonadaceae bacterium]